MITKLLPWLASLSVGGLVLGSIWSVFGRERAAGPAGGPGAPPATATEWVVSTLAGQPPGPERADGDRRTARFHQLVATACDARGNVYVAENTAVRKITPAGQVSTLLSLPPDRLEISQGRLVSITEMPKPGEQSLALALGGIAVAPDGTVYVSNRHWHVIVRISPAGQASILAGQYNQRGYADGPAARAQFAEPGALALDAQGNLYVAETGNYTIRKITPAGVVSTLAGKAGAREPDERTYPPGQRRPVLSPAAEWDGTGPQARFFRPTALAMGPDGWLYVADSGDNTTIRRISPRGEVKTWAGRARNAEAGTWPGAHLDLEDILGLAVGPDGTVYLTENRPGWVPTKGGGSYANFGRRPRVVRRIRADGSETPWAGSPTEQGHRDADTPGAAVFRDPRGLALAPDGALLVLDETDRLVRRIALGGQVSTLAGALHDPAADGPGPLARFERPIGVAVDAQGTVYVADAGNNAIRHVSPAGEVTTWAGKRQTNELQDGMVGQANLVDGPVAQARFNALTALALGRDGSVYATEGQCHVVRKISPQGVVSTFAGRDGQYGTRDGLASLARFNNLTSVAAAPDGTVYVTDGESSAVRRITPRGWVSTLVPGKSLYVHPLSNEARYYTPSAVAVGPDGSVYVLRSEVYRYPPGSRTGTLLAGDPTAAGGADDLGPRAQFNEPTGLAVDALGYVYVADAGNQCIRRISPQGDVTTIAGLAGSPEPYRDGLGAQARFNRPSAVAVGPDGAIYVADSGNNCIRVIRGR
jgi:DNA-binding beta-propeller fold protein YncE